MGLVPGREYYHLLGKAQARILDPPLTSYGMQGKFLNPHGHQFSSLVGMTMGFPGGASDKEPTCQCRIHKRCGFSPWTGKIPWRRAWQPTPVFLPGESHGQRSPVGYSPWGRKESDMTDQYRHDHSGTQILVMIRTK